MDTGLVQSGLFWLLLKLRTTLERSRGAAIHPPSSSRVALNVIFNFIPKVLLEGSKGMVTPGTAGMDSHGMCCWIPMLPLAGPSSQQGKGPWLSPRALNPYKECSTRISTGEWSGEESTITRSQLRYIQTACYSIISASRKNHTVLVVCAYEAQRCWARENLTLCDPCASQGARQTPHSWHVILSPNLTACY